jgi:hypothetical protein
LGFFYQLYITDINETKIFCNFSIKTLQKHGCPLSVIIYAQPKGASLWFYAFKPKRSLCFAFKILQGFEQAKRRILLAPSCKGHAQAKTNKIKVQIEDLLRFDCTMRDHCPMRSQCPLLVKILTGFNKHGFSSRNNLVLRTSMHARSA